MPFSGSGDVLRFLLKKEPRLLTSEMDLNDSNRIQRNLLWLQFFHNECSVRFPQQYNRGDIALFPSLTLIAQYLSRLMSVSFTVHVSLSTCFPTQIPRLLQSLS